MAVVQVTAAQFQNEVVGAKGLVLVDFYADWCGPCKMIAPVIEELSKQYDGQVKFAKVNVDDAQDIAAEFGVSSIPTLILFKDGKKKDQAVGAVPKSQIEAFLKKNMA